MGYHEFYNRGAFKDWAEGGGAVDKSLTPRMSGHDDGLR
jgi:hypothetical protein